MTIAKGAGSGNTAAGSRRDNADYCELTHGPSDSPSHPVSPIPASRAYAGTLDSASGG
jgi:hypothetical protein